jgi:hypothetical protein
MPLLGRPARSLFILSFGMSCAMLAGFFSAEYVKEVALQGLTNRAKPIIEAIHAFERDHSGRCPNKLEQLVPKYISAAPSTGWSAHPDFFYTDSAPTKFNWLLSVPCSSGWFECDSSTGVFHSCEHLSLSLLVFAPEKQHHCAAAIEFAQLHCRK